MKQVVEILPSSRSSISLSLKQNVRRVTQPWVHNMIREELALVKQNGGWKPQGKKRIIWPFLPSKWVKFSVLLIKFFFCCSELIRVHFYFIFIFLFDPSWSESRSFPDRRSELIRSDFCTCLFLNSHHWKGFQENNDISWGKNNNH